VRVLTTVLEFVGLALVVTGVTLLSIPAAFIVGGLGLVLVSWRLTR
jgi:hypothetical protein